MTLQAVRSIDLLDRFVVPETLEAAQPPEDRGVERDDVRLMVTGPDGVRHHRFTDLPSLLEPGDLLVVNDSDTLPAAVSVDNHRVIHLSTRLPGGLWLVEMREASGPASTPARHVEAGRIDLPGGGQVDLLAPYAPGARRLWVAAVNLGGPEDDYLRAWGRPIRYRHVDAAYPLDAYRTVFARVPGSAEMPSAGRPFSGRLLAALAACGVLVAPITLHTGVSSLEAPEPPYPEWCEVPSVTAELINHVHRNDGRVIAVGTTVVRALETAADTRGSTHPLRTWTDLVISPTDNMAVVDGMITGWHEPRSSHLDMLEALVGRDRLVDGYAEALERGYLWHEFGDSHLLIAQR